MFELQPVYDGFLSIQAQDFIEDAHTVACTNCGMNS